MTNLFYSNFDTVFDSMLNWDNDSRSISTPTSYIKDDVLKIELEVPGLSNKDVDVKVDTKPIIKVTEKTVDAVKHPEKAVKDVKNEAKKQTNKAKEEIKKKNKRLRKLLRFKR